MSVAEERSVRVSVFMAAVLSSAAVFAEEPPVPNRTMAEGTVGVPVTYRRGITETVDGIMAREPVLTPPLPAGQRSDPPESDPKRDTAVIPPNLPQTVGTSFKATDFAESLYFPPQTAGDVGPTQVLVHVNGRIKVFDKNGIVGALNASAASFWASVAPAAAPTNPQVRYDRLSGRWFVFAVTPEAPDNSMVIAVSSGPAITGAGSFTFYSFPFTIANWFGDYWGDISVGIDANAVYIGCNQYFQTSSVVPWTAAFVVRKSSLTGGGPIVVTGFPAIASNADGGPFAPRGVDNDDPTWNEGYFIGTDKRYLGRLSLIRVTDPGGTPTLSASMALSIADTDLLNQSQGGTTFTLDTNSRRLYAASIHKNKLTGATSLWTAQSVETDLTCTPADTGNARRLGAKWYEIGNLTTTPTVTQFGTLCTTALGNGVTNTERGFLDPTVTGTGQGHVALASSYASRTEFAGIAAAGRLRTDPAAGTRAPETIVLLGVTAYARFDTGGHNYWGDYSFTDVDPTDDQTVWTFQEYAETPSGNWAIRAVQLKAPPPPNLASATNSVCVGAAAIPVTINGTDSCAAPACTNGLCVGGGPCPEFFDPGPDAGGPGYTKHIAASVTGGVTVTSAGIVLPADPSTQRVLSVALSLNTTAATPGTKVVTITNPDGQFKSAGLITVISNRPPVSTTGGTDVICQGGSVMLDGTGSTDPDTACGDSVAAYAWDLNNDGTFDVTGPTPTVTAAQLAALGVGVGVNTIKLRVTDTHGATNTGSGTLTLLAEGAGCSDANACTQTDTCQTGVCTGSNPVVCAPSDTCHVAGTCTAGVCSNPPAPDGTGCEDGIGCTSGETCTAGACGGGTPNPPGELVNAHFTNATTLVWDTIPDGPHYDVLRGDLAALPVGPGSGDEICFDELLTAVLVDGTPPAPGSGFWYVIRASNVCGIGGYGTQHDLTPRSSTTCP